LVASRVLQLMPRNGPGGLGASSDSDRLPTLQARRKKSK